MTLPGCTSGFWMPTSAPLWKQRPSKFASATLCGMASSCECLVAISARATPIMLSGDLIGAGLKAEGAIANEAPEFAVSGSSRYRLMPGGK
jgi:hypothetical protein